MPAAALSLNFAEAIVISNTEGGESKREGKKPEEVSHNADRQMRFYTYV